MLLNPRRQGLVNQQAGIQSNITSINSEIASSRDSLATALGQIDRQISQNQAKITASQKTLTINKKILAELQPAGTAGAIARTQIDRQEQEVVTRDSELEQQIQEQSRLQLEKNRLVSTSKSDTQRQQQRIQEQQQTLKQRQSEIAQLDEEHARLKLSASQSTSKLANSTAVNRKDLFTRIAENDKRIAEIDSQLNKSIVENEKKITEITNQIAQANQSLKYQEIHAPVAGEVFELKVYPEGVVNSNSPEPLVQIIPSKDAIAKVYITNKDIGFVKIGQQVDVRIDTFNFSEFGDVKGTIEWIGSDALPPDQIYPFARFPAKIRLSQQTLTVAKIIDHLFHLPLSYFDRRAVGELSTRIVEIDKIRQFFTSTAFNTVLDAVFSVMYIGVMLLYSPFLTAVALSTLPLFVLLSFIVSPIVRRQLRVKAECNAQNQSYLVEALSGIYTVKAQSMERRSRNQWQTFYDRYVAASFNSIITYTLAGSSSNFLNQVSSILVLWVGSSLVLDSKLTLGQLIAFRIIAGYVTNSGGFITA